MKKTNILTLMLMLTVSVAFGQTFNYSLNYGSIKFGNSATGQHQFNGLANFVNGITIPLRAESDSSANAASTQWVKRLVQGLGSPLTFSNGLTKTGNNVGLGGSVINPTVVEVLGENSITLTSSTETTENLFSFSKYDASISALEFLGGNNDSRNLIISKNTAAIGREYNSLQQYLTFRNDGIVLRDEIYSKGIRYDKDYSKTFVLADSNYLAPKAYVDRQIASLPSSPVTSVNGRTGAVTGLAEATDLTDKASLTQNNFFNSTASWRIV